jgi:TRAP-type C4-dicarboxylate transport system substrate-binding protein
MLHKARQSAVGAALAGSLLSLSPSAGAETTLTISSWVPPSHHLTRVVLEGFVEEVEKASAGRLKFQMLPKHPVAASDTFDAVRDGLVDVSFITASYTPRRLLLPLVAEFPGAGETAEITSVAYSRLHWRYLHDASEHDASEYKGLHLLAVFTHGPGQLFNTRRPVERLADLQGMKLRTGGSIAEAMARALGASVVVNPVNPNARTDNRELLDAGLADGVLFPQDAIASFGLDGVVKYATLFPGGLFNFAFGFVMNQDKWDKLAKQDQQLLSRFGGESFARRAGKSWDNADRLGNEGMKKAGVRFDTANQTFIEEVQAKAQPIIQNWVNEVKEKRNIDGAMLLREFHDELKRVAAGE